MKKKWFEAGDHVWTLRDGIKRYGYVVAIDDEPDRAVVALYEAFPSDREVVSRHFSRLHLANLSTADVDKIVGRKSHTSVIV